MVLEESPVGLTWTIDEPLARSSHALLEGGRLWLIDPVDEPAALERALALGRPTAVLQLLDRHNRDCAALADQLGVPQLKVPDVVLDTPFSVVPVVGLPLWREIALWWPGPRVLVVAEAVGTSPAYAPAGMGAGISLGLRPWPPRRLGAFEPEHLLVGHGPALHGPRATAALHEALGRARRDLPRGMIALPRALGSAPRSRLPS